MVPGAIHGDLNPSLLLGDQALHELGPLLLVGLDAFVQQHFADLDSAGRRCAPGVHKPRARMFRSRPMPMNRGRIGGGHARVKVESKSSMAAICARFHNRGT
jgi:hypothetical protein